MECRDLAHGGPRRGLSVRCTFICFHILAEGAWVALDDALEPPTAACWREGGWVGSEVDPSMTLHALLGPRDRDNRFLSRFLKQQIIHPALRGRERCTYPLPKQFPLSLGHPSRGLLLLLLPPVDGGQDGRGGLPTPSLTAPLLKAAADAVRELQPADGWRQQLSAEAGSVRSPQSAPVQPGTAGPCYRLRRRRGQSGIQEPWGTELCRRPYVNQTQPEVALLDHKCGHRTTQRLCHNLRRSWREVRCGMELFQSFRIVTTPVYVPQCF